MKILILVVLLLSGASVSGVLKLVDLALGESKALPAASVASAHPGALKKVDPAVRESEGLPAGRVASARAGALQTGDLAVGEPGALNTGDVASPHAGALQTVDLAMGESQALYPGSAAVTRMGALGVGDLALVRSGAVRASGPSAVKSIWQWPLVGPDGSPPTVTRPFDPPVHRWLPGHRGVDLVAPGATEVLAAGPGTVAFAGTLFGQGVVVVAHGAVRTSYEPVSPAATLHVGDSVAAGTPLGTLNPGHCRGSPCLHWGLLTGHGHGVRYYDPLLLLGLVHLRLEPVG
jgi:murein DD-endopeptidase MepM/ murein hydrolase activator NlpD